MRCLLRSTLVLVLAASLAACAESPFEPGTAPGGSAGAAPEVLRLLAGYDGDGETAVAVFGIGGGTLELHGHRLVVPATAVITPTVFRMTLTHEGEIAVDLEATSLGSRTPNNVGARGFRRPVGLELSYASSTAVRDPSTLLIVWLHSQADLTPLTSTVDTGAQVVRAQLNHFSGYAIADRTITNTTELLGY